MMRDLKNFMAGCLSLPVGWQIWLMMLGSANMFPPPPFFLSHTEAHLALIVFMLSFMMAYPGQASGVHRPSGVDAYHLDPLGDHLWGQLPLHPFNEG